MVRISLPVGWCLVRTGALPHHFGADAAVGEDFQQKGVGEAAIDEVHFAHAGVQCIHGTADIPPEIALPPPWTTMGLMPAF